MGKKGSIHYQVNVRFEELYRIGKSKHEAKKAERERCRKEGRKWNPARVEGIHSIVTFKTYKSIAHRFADFVRDEKGVRDLEKAREFVAEYLKKSIEEGKSAWTVRLEAAALAKLYQCSSTDFCVKLPYRHRSDIKRSRVSREHDKKFSESKNSDLVKFCRATGLRRHELKALSYNDIFRGENGRVYVHVVQGKGGRERTVTVLRKYEMHVLEVREKARSEGREKVFERIPNRADVHAYRREYARERYKELEKEGVKSGEKYVRRDGRIFNREILKIVSRELGHNRVDVVARHYLD